MFCGACKCDFIRGANRIGVNAAIRTRVRRGVNVEVNCQLFNFWLYLYEHTTYTRTVEVMCQHLYVKIIRQVLREQTHPTGGGQAPLSFG